MPTPAPGQYVHITEHFVIYYTDELSATHLPRLAEKLETAWREIPAFLGIDPPAKPIRVYTGLHTSANWGLVTGVIVLHPTTLDGKAYGVIAHEFTHVLSRYSGPMWMEEGLAVYVQEQFPLGDQREPKIAADSWSAALLQADKWVPLWEWPLGIPDSIDPIQELAIFRAYRESGSFVRYLTETYGMTSFWKMHDNPSGWYAAKDVYGKSVDDLLEEWRQSLEVATIPADQCPECLHGFIEYCDIKIAVYENSDRLSNEVQGQIDEELGAAYEAFQHLAAVGMQQHIDAARELLDVALQDPG